MKKFNLFIIILIMTISLYGCSSYSYNDEGDTSVYQVEALITDKDTTKNIKVEDENGNIHKERGGHKFQVQYEFRNNKVSRFMDVTKSQYNAHKLGDTFNLTIVDHTFKNGETKFHNIYYE